ncbi:DUF4169 family protein [Aerophototrophica crusticola]|uniref:DUF4169 family protein n=2 Tax=Aerophototrophica crusticola TaxID=1709002 RepID=A0A858RBI9_9PROT|nr:DUF4169 family protein [Rhodospirillaceae bacterium B3]
MGEIVNLNRFRKAREKADREQRAIENRAKFGQSKLANRQREALDRKADKLLDGHRLGKRDGEPE